MRQKTIVQLFFISLILFNVIHANPSEETQKQFLAQFIKPRSLVFDVGAHVGSKTKLYLALGARVVAVEPQPSCCDIMRRSFGQQSIVIEQIGLSDTPGTLELSVCSSSPTISTFSQEWVNESRFSKRAYKWDHSISVPVDTLDNLIARYGIPDFCKIDVENFEYQVLRGLSQPIPLLSIEFAIETLHNTKRCLEHLESLGYTQFNFARAEEPSFARSWMSCQNLILEIQKESIEYQKKQNDLLWGDVYASTRINS